MPDSSCDNMDHTVWMPHLRSESACGRRIGIVSRKGQQCIEEASLTTYRTTLKENPVGAYSQASVCAGHNEQSATNMTLWKSFTHCSHGNT